MSLAPALLVSMPQLADPNFARTVVLLCEHGPDGALGLVVNRTAEVGAAGAVEFEPPLDTPNQIPLHLGGPVEPERGWILTTQKPEVEHKDLGGGLYLYTPAANFHGADSIGFLLRDEDLESNDAVFEFACRSSIRT